MKDILQRELDGELIRTDDPEYEAIIGTIWKTMKLASKLNTSLLDVEENRKIFIEIFGKEYDESTVILPPFYVDYGKNITLGKNDWIQQGCTFMDRGGITLGDNVFIAPKVNLVTLNHAVDPALRSATVAKPIVIEDNVWIGIGATVLQGVTIGKNSIVAAGAVVTRDVTPDTIAAGNPARIVKRIERREA